MEEVEPAKEVVAIKRSAAAIPVVPSPSAPKKRAHEELSSSLGATQPKKPKLKEEREMPMNKNRHSFRKNIFDVLLIVVALPEYIQLELESGQAHPSNDMLQQLSNQIEVAWLEKCGWKTAEAYLEQMRALRFSLKANPSLVVRLVSGVLSPIALSRMTAEDMAPAKARAALKELQAEDEMNRNKAAETVDETKHEKSMFHIRGKSDDRILPMLPSYQPTTTDEDDLKANKRDAELAASTEAALPTLGESGLLTAPLLNASTKVVDLDLDSFDVTKVKVQSLSTVNPETAAALAATLPAQPQASAIMSLKKNDSEVNTGIRSILQEIAMEAAGAPQTNGHLEYNPSDPFAHDPAEQYQTSRTMPTTSRPRDSRGINPDDRIWRGALSYPGACPDARVELVNVSGPKIESVLHRTLITSFEIAQRVDLKKIMDYFPQLESSASRVTSLLFFEPAQSDMETEQRYAEMFKHLDSISRAGVVSIAGSIAAEGTFKEIYVLPVKANDFTYSPSVIPVNYVSSTHDRLYFCVISDKKKLEKSHLDWRAAGGATRSLAGVTAPLSGLSAPSSGVLGGSVLGGGILGGMPARSALGPPVNVANSLSSLLGPPPSYLSASSPPPVAPMVTSTLPYPSSAPPMLGGMARGAGPSLGGPPPGPSQPPHGAPMLGPRQPPPHLPPPAHLGGPPRPMYNMPPGGAPPRMDQPPPPSYGRPDPYRQPPRGWDNRGPPNYNAAPPPGYPGPPRAFNGPPAYQPPPAHHMPYHAPSGPPNMPPLSGPAPSLDQATAALDSLAGVDLDKLLGSKP